MILLVNLPKSSHLAGLLPHNFPSLLFPVLEDNNNNNNKNVTRGMERNFISVSSLSSAGELSKDTVN